MTNETTPTMESLTGLTDREILHKLLDKILDANGEENSAIWTEFFPGYKKERSIQVEYRLTIQTSKGITYTEL